MNEIFKFLEDLKVDYDIYEHPPIHRVGDDTLLGIKLPGLQTKNLFLKDKKSKKFFLVSMAQDSKMDLKEFGIQLGGMKFSFGKPEDLKRLLNVEPGSVCVLGKIYDLNNEVEVVIDQKLLNAELVASHPNLNTKTLVFPKKSFKKILKSFKYISFDFNKFL